MGTSKQEHTDFSRNGAQPHPSSYDDILTPQLRDDDWVDLYLHTFRGCIIASSYTMVLNRAARNLSLHITRPSQNIVYHRPLLILGTIFLAHPKYADRSNFSLVAFQRKTQPKIIKSPTSVNKKRMLSITHLTHFLVLEMLILQYVVFNAYGLPSRVHDAALTRLTVRCNKSVRMGSRGWEKSISYPWSHDFKHSRGCYSS